MVAWMEITCAQVMGYGEIKLSQLTGDVAQHEPRHVRVRLELCGPFKIGPCFCHADSLPPTQTFIDQFSSTRRSRRIRFGRGNRLGGCAGGGSGVGRNDFPRRRCAPERRAADKYRSDLSQQPPKGPKLAPAAH